MDWKLLVVIAGFGGAAYLLRSKKGTAQLYNLIATGAVTALGQLVWQGIQEQESLSLALTQKYREAGYIV